MGQASYLAPDIEHATTLARNGALSRIFKVLPGLPQLWVASYVRTLVGEHAAHLVVQWLEDQSGHRELD